MSSARDAPIDGSSLCTGCALCCQGVIHDFIRIYDEEAIEDLGLAIELHNEQRYVPLPCPHVKGTLCSVYERRPKACAGYQCALLRRFLSGEVSREQALERVAEAKRLLAEVREVLLPGQSLQDARRECGGDSAGWSADDSGAPGQAARRRLRVMALNRFLDQHFRNDADQKFVTLD
jgi:Fe-S-cluster containining protein